MADSDTHAASGGARTAEVQTVSRVYSGFMSLEEAVVSYSGYDGEPRTVTRLSLERGDSVAVVMLERNRRKVWLTEQFRYPTLRKGPGWMVEVPAGMIDAGELPADAARREAEEETGVAPLALEEIATFYVSPGGTSERVVLYFAEFDTGLPNTSSGRHEPDAEEDIRLIERDLDQFIDDARCGRLDDAKTLIAGLWLLANRARFGA